MNETEPQTFFCADCHQDKPIGKNGGTGYAELTEAGQKKRICYACIAPRDKATMIADGKAVLYLTYEPFVASDKFTDGKVSNWPGSLSLPARVRKGHHNIARTRYDVWFTGPDGKEWHGVQLGENSQLTRCKRIKSK